MDFIDGKEEFRQKFQGKAELRDIYHPFVNLVLLDLDFSHIPNFTRHLDVDRLPQPDDEEFSEAFGFLRELRQLVEFNARGLKLGDILRLPEYIPLPQLKALRLVELFTGQTYTTDDDGDEEYRPFADKVRTLFHVFNCSSSISRLKGKFGGGSINDVP